MDDGMTPQQKSQVQIENELCMCMHTPVHVHKM